MTRTRAARILTPLTTLARWLTILLPVWIVAGPAPADMAISLLGILFLVRSAITRDFSWIRKRWVQVALILGLYMTVRGLFIEPWLLRSSDGTIWLRFPIGGAALAYWLLPDEQTRKRFFSVLLATLVFITADCLWQFFHGFDIFGNPIFVTEETRRLTGPFSKPRPGIITAWLLFPVLLSLMAKPPGRRGVVFGIAALLVIYITGERMALLLSLMGMGLAFLALPSLRWRLCVTGAAAVALMVVFSIQFPFVKDRQLGRTQTQLSGFWHLPPETDQPALNESSGFWHSAYGKAWRSAAQVGAAYPVFGTGIKQFQRECQKPEFGTTDPQFLGDRCPMHPHHLYLSWFTEFGAVGLGLFLLMIGCWAAEIVAARRRWWGDPVATGLIIALIMRLWPISVIPNYMTAWPAVPMWLVLAWLFAILSRPALDERR